MLRDLIAFAVEHPFSVVNLFIGAAISFYGVCVISKMTKNTPMLCWLGYALIACGGFGVAVGFLYGYWTRSPAEVLTNAGLLITIICRSAQHSDSVFGETK